MPDFPTPGQTDFDQGENVEPGQIEFSADEEKAMRQASPNFYERYNDDVMSAEEAAPATFRERFNANPEGSFAVMRPSTNVEDYRNEPLADKITGDLYDTWDRSSAQGPGA